MTYTIFIYLYDGRLFFTGCLNLYFEKYKGIGPGYYDRPIMALPQNCSAEDVSAAIQHCVIEMEEPVSTKIIPNTILCRWTSRFSKISNCLVSMPREKRLFSSPLGL